MPRNPVRRAFLRDRVGPIVNLPVQFVRRGLVRPGPPGPARRQLAALRRWGTTLAGEFISAAARDPDRPALVDARGSLTYAEVDARTSRLAAAFAGMAEVSGRDGADRGGSGSPPRVGVLCRNHRGMVETLIACAKIGADVVLLNTGMGTDQVLRVIDEHGVRLLVADAEFDAVLSGVPDGLRTVIAAPSDDAPSDDAPAEDARSGGAGAGTLDELIEHTPYAEPEPPRRPGRIVILSSGTTGRPKGAQRPPRPSVRALASILSRIPFRVHDTVLVEAPLFHTWGYAGMQFTLAVRGTLVLRGRFDPADALATIERDRCTAMIAVPVMVQRIMELPAEEREPHDTSSLRVVALSGSALPAGLAVDFMDAFGDTLYNLYGSTEASWVAIATPGDLRANPGTAGRPPLGTVVAIRGPDGEPLPPGRTGQIFAANEAMFEGYTGGESSEMWHGLIGLGDVGHLDDGGRLQVEGRDDDMIVSGGENIFPRSVEDVLSQMAEVREVTVVGVPDEKYGQRLAAYVVTQPGETLDEDAVRERVRANLARFAVPRDVHFLDELPRNATGKVVPRLLPGREREPR